MAETKTEAAAKTPDPHIYVEHGIAIRKWDGKPINTAGVYDMTLEQYHSHNCAGPSISSSGLRTIEDESPAHYWVDSYLNPKRTIDVEQKKELNIGTAAHLLLLGESGFAEKCAVLPPQWSDFKGGAAKEWRAEMWRQGRLVLTQKDIEVIRAVARSMEKDPFIRAGLFNGMTEKSLIWKDEETGVWLKARPDTISADAATIVDLKTLPSADHHSCQNQIKDYGYHMQLALAGMGVEAVLGRKISNDGHIICFAEKKAPNCCNIKVVDAEAIMWGRMLCRRALRKFADCWAKKEWPGYADSGNNISLPAWLNDRYREQHKNGSLD